MNLQGMDDLKEGDTVFKVHLGGWGSKTIAEMQVARVTPKQFRCGKYYKFRKSDGMEICGSSRTWDRDHAYPDNESNRKEYEQYLEDEHIKCRVRDLISKVVPAIKRLREGDLDKIEAVAAILLGAGDDDDHS
jgi:hypothetical protein